MMRYWVIFFQNFALESSVLFFWLSNLFKTYAKRFNETISQLFRLENNLAKVLCDFISHNVKKGKRHCKKSTNSLESKKSILPATLYTKNWYKPIHISLRQIKIVHVLMSLRVLASLVVEILITLFSAFFEKNEKNVYF